MAGIAEVDILDQQWVAVADKLAAGKWVADR